MNPKHNLCDTPDAPSGYSIIQMSALLLCLTLFPQFQLIAGQKEAIQQELKNYEKEAQKLDGFSLITKIKEQAGSNVAGTRTKAFISAKQLARLCQVATDDKLIMEIMRNVNDSAIPEQTRFLLLNAAFQPGKAGAQNLISFIKDSGQPLLLRRQAIKSLGTARQEAWGETLPFLKDIVLNGKEQQLVDTAIWCFYDKDYPPIVDALLKRLNDPGPSTRSRVIRVLAHPNRIKPNQIEKNPRLIPALIKSLDDSDVNVGNRAIEALANLNIVDALPKFEAMLADSLKDKPIDEGARRWTIVRALGVMKDTGSEKILIESINDPDDLIASHAAESLAKRDIKRALPLLRSKIKKMPKKDWYTRKRLLKAIKRLEQN